MTGWPKIEKKVYEVDEKSISEFVVFCARYPNRQPLEIAKYIFRDHDDCDDIADQICEQWENDLNIQERIRLARINGGDEPLDEEDEKAKLQKELLALARDEKLAAKDRAKFYELALTSKQMLPKQVEKAVSKKAKIPAINIVKYEDKEVSEDVS